MGNTYQIIKQLENTAPFLTLLKKGLVSITIFEKKVFYEFFLNDFKTTKSKTQSILNTSEEFGKSESTIKRAIRFMEN